MGNMKANRKFVEGEEAVSAVIGVILMVAITVAIAATVYVYVSGMLTGPGSSAPNLAWTIDDSADTLTITSGSASNEYGASATDGNLILKKGTTSWYVSDGYTVQTSQGGLATLAIAAGDVLQFPTTTVGEGTWQIVWQPTDKLLGEVTFT